MTGRPIHDDGLVELDETGMTLRRYYFPLGTAKRIPYEEIRGVREQQLGALTGRGRFVGHHWSPVLGAA